MRRIIRFCTLSGLILWAAISTNPPAITTPAGSLATSIVMPGSDKSIASEEPEIYTDLTYCRIDGVELTLDLAKPPAADNKGPYPALVFMHGGGWKEGSRKQYETEIVEAVRRGYVSVTITYRLTEEMDDREEGFRWPAQLQDTRSAIRFLRANANTYSVDPDRIGATGHSAGGHLALMAGLAQELETSDPPDCHTNVPLNVQAVVNQAGTTDMFHAHQDSIVRPYAERFLGGTPEEAPKAYEESSPIRYISPDDPPVLTIHGDQDEVVSVEHAYILDEAIREGSGRHELFILEGSSHVFTDQYAEQAREAMYDFFDRHLQ